MPSREMRCGSTIVSQKVNRQYGVEKEGGDYTLAKTRLSAGKVLVTVFWDFKGVLHINFPREHQTINVAYYWGLLGETKLVDQQKRQSFSKTSYYCSA